MVHLVAVNRGEGVLRAAVTGQGRCDDRRKFVDAESQTPADVMWIIQRIGDLYAIERQAAELGVACTVEHLKIRLQISALIVEAIREWLAIKNDEAPPKSQFGKALGHLDKRMQRLTVFLTDPRVPLDNNEAERPLRRMAPPRESSFFVGYDASGQRYAIVLRSLCRADSTAPMPLRAWRTCCRGCRRPRPRICRRG